LKTPNLSTASWLALTAVLLPVASLAQGNSAGHAADTPADGRGNLIRQLPPRGAAHSSGSVVQGNGISYHNGPVMHSGINVYYIWYGNWNQDPGANAILTDFATKIGGSPYFSINTTYGDTSGNVQNSVTYAGSTSDSGSLGTSLSDSSILTLVNNAISSSALPKDPNGMYFVLTAPYVGETSGFLTQYCGWHTYANIGGTPIKYSFVGNAAANLGACAAQSTSPNGDAAADGMASVIAHELEEAATDPQLNAWYDSTGAENGDKCAWTFGSTYSVSNGSKANMKLGVRDFLIQQNWLNAGGGYCTLSYAASPDFSLSVSPTSQSVAPGGTTGSYNMTATPINGWTGTVTYSVTSGLPSGATATVSGSAITIATTTAVAAGSYSFTIQGTDSIHTHTTTATLVVTSPTFSISASPSSLSVSRPGVATYTVTVSPTGGFTGTVNLTASGGATGITLALSPASVTGSGTSALTATVTSSAKKGSRKLTVTGTSGSITKSTSVTLQIN
jgi:hypothetical protein